LFDHPYDTIVYNVGRISHHNNVFSTIWLRISTGAQIYKSTMTLTTELNTIILHFPQRMWGGWMDLKVLHDSIKRGGFPEVARKDVANALKGLTKDPRVHTDKIGNRASRNSYVLYCIYAIFMLLEKTKHNYPKNSLITMLLLLLLYGRFVYFSTLGELMQTMVIWSRKYRNTTMEAKEWRLEVAYRTMLLLRTIVAVLEYPTRKIPAWTVPELSGIELQVCKQQEQQSPRSYNKMDESYRNHDHHHGA
jgi:hypothetical protein